MRRFATTSIFLVFTSLLACKGPLPCDNCDAADEDETPTDIPNDLPCGGADLSSDPENCGECGVSCFIRGKDTEWEAGGCEHGECQRTWSSCLSLSNNPKSCADYCGGSCVANGCLGHTAIFFAPNPFNPACLPDLEPFATFDGACDEPLIMDPPEEGLGVTFMCCCG